MMYVPVLLSVAIVEKLELIGVCCMWRVDLFLFSCVCFVLLKMGDSDARNM